MLALVERAVRETPRALVILDLDSTLYNTSLRTHAIVREWARANHGELPSPLIDAVHRLDSVAPTYSMRDLFTALGLDLSRPEVASACDQAKDFWKNRFFSDAYVPHDTAYPGAAEFVTGLHRQGARIVYLTGRDAPGMERGTRETLVRDGFPVDHGILLLMKAAREGDDLEHKLDSVRGLPREGTVVASFENEPRNLVGIAEIFPQAIHVFVETVCSDAPAPAWQGLYRIRRFPSARYGSVKE